ncbi:MAG: apolipoprotein N-acyltransferase [Candidatus Eisenbacteria bacterium]|uniref:Apolipoprotein N-acyltransferase n=1 Tax=Eiseniibacteriota bacterium TaxID=2212470 RepID=A0A9D6QIU9_UNCEI|nr:apolipoprotein N-acyltransferase [Candidatus Eisenbacteria bacterium]MBI3539827.1 apolipoprotein N-acyltransferase [Candidatus Eisenbacteria bacterium]
MLLGLAFFPLPLGFLAWFGFIPLLAALDRKLRDGEPLGAIFGLGYTFGFVFYLIGTHWIALLSDVAITVPWLKYPAWVAAAAYLALYAGLTTTLAGWLARRARVPLALTFPLALIAVEELRASGEMGFPWFQPGYTQHAYAPILQLASLGSVSLVTLWIAALNVLAWRALTGGARLRAALGAALLLALPWAWGTRVLDAAPKRPGPVVALIQGNVAGEIKWSGHHQKEILDTFVLLSEQAAGHVPRPAITIWPETATGSYLRKQLDQALTVAALASRTRIPVFSGFADYAYDAAGHAHPLNAAGLFAPDGAMGEVYAKRHLVPFGERMPFESLFPGLAKIELGQAEWTAGAGPVLFPSAAGPFTCLICFESIFPDLAREDVRRGARWLVNITNDEWFGDGAALYQHAAMAPFRAVENHVPLARCANTGLTLIADANGRVTQRIAVWRPGVLIAALGSPGIPTFYTRFGDWPGMGCMIAVAALALWSFIGGRRGTRDAAAATAAR